MKISEAMLVKLLKGNKVWVHKWQDMRICARCGAPIFVTNHNDVLGESIVDYLAFTDGTPHWIECKGTPRTKIFSFSKITEKQRSFLTSFAERNVSCWLFLVMGINNSRSVSLLIDWTDYLAVEKQLLNKRKSFSYPGVETLFSNYLLLNAPKGLLKIPDNHSFRKFL
jgi:hypothetical protein